MYLGWSLYFVLALDDIREYFPEMNLADNLDQLRIADLSIFAEIEVVSDDEIDRVVFQFENFIEELLAIFSC